MAKNDVAHELEKINSSITDLKSEMSAGFTRVDTELNAAKIRDEEMRGLIKLTFEAQQGHRESTEAQFGAVRTDIREQTDLLKSVLVHVRQRVERVEARKPRRRS